MGFENRCVNFKIIGGHVNGGYARKWRAFRNC